MISDVRIYVIVGLFAAACIALMMFNFIIIRYSKSKNAFSAGKNKKWRNILCKHAIIASGKKSPCFLKHETFLLKNLCDAENLVAYACALQYLKDELPEAYRDYINKRHGTFQKLAEIYSRKTSVERACYADFVCNFPQVTDDAYGPLVNTLVSYIEDPSVHCRTNALRALCNIGNVQGVVNALQITNDKSLFVHNHILTNELLGFKGDKEILGKHLWKKSHCWSERITVSVIQFITSFSKHYRETFLPVLQNSSVDIEVRIAIIRYYGKYRYRLAHPILAELANTTDSIAIEATAALNLCLVTDTTAARKSTLSAPKNVQYDNDLAKERDKDKKSA